MSANDPKRTFNKFAKCCFYLFDLLGFWTKGSALPQLSGSVAKTERPAFEGLTSDEPKDFAGRLNCIGNKVDHT